MSVKISSLVWEARIPSLQKLLLLAFADVANDDGYCVFRKGEEMTRGQLAYKTCLSEKTIQRSITELLNPDNGLLEITKAASHHSPPEYRIKVERLTAINRITRVDSQSTQRPVDNSVQGGLPVRSGWTPSPFRVDSQSTQRPVDNSVQGGLPVRSGWTPSPFRVDSQSGWVDSQSTHNNVVDVESRNYSLSHVVLTESERETCLGNLKRFFPALLSIPKEIPMERVYLFLHKIRLGEIDRKNIYSPIAYLGKMMDEDISEPLRKEREARARAQVGG